MKTFKRADLAFQAALIIGFTITALINPGSLFLAYFVVGSLQVLSMIIHALKSWNTRKGSKRFYYHRITLFVIITATLAAIVPYFFPVWYALLFLAPLMAVYYLWICYYEVAHAAKRPLEMI